MKHSVPIKLDAIDKRILRALQRNGRLQNIELAAEVGLSPSPCLRRVKQLEEAEVIQRYVAVLDPAKVGLHLSFFARVWLHAQDADTIDRFLAAVQELPQVVECYIMLGDCDAMLRVVATDFEDYRQFQIEHLNRKSGVERIKTEVPSQIVKQTFALPLR